jgi:hypothetical protein
VRVFWTGFVSALCGFDLQGLSARIRTYAFGKVGPVGVVSPLHVIQVCWGVHVLKGAIGCGNRTANWECRGKLVSSCLLERTARMSVSVPIVRAATPWAKAFHGCGAATDWLYWHSRQTAVFEPLCLCRDAYAMNCLCMTLRSSRCSTTR